MENKRWTTSNKAVYNLGYHIIWCPKYRRKLLTNSVETRLKELLYKKADELGLTIETCEIMPDHVHLFIKSSPVDSPHFIVQQLKGYTSRILRQEFPQLKTRVPTLWTRSYYIESVGHISESTVKKYIEDQKTSENLLFQNLSFQKE
jgi:putative transposase